MRHLVVLSSLALAAACGHEDWPSHLASSTAHAEHAPCRAQIDLSPAWEEGGKHIRALNLTLSGGSEGVPVPYHVTTKGLSVTAVRTLWNASDDGSSKDGLKLLVKDDWQTLKPSGGNAVKIGGIFEFTGDGNITEVAVNGQPCAANVSDGPKVQDDPSKEQTETKVAPKPEEPVAANAPAPVPVEVPAPVAAPTPAPAPASAPAPAPAADGDDAALKETVRGYVQKLMNVPRQVEGDSCHAPETRGGPGNFEKLSSAQVDEFVATIIHSGRLFAPPHLSDEEKAALVACDISAESAFQLQTAGMNPNPIYGQSVGVQQVTTSIWLKNFKERAQLPGLKRYDGSPWDISTTSEEEVANSVWVNSTIACWAISEQAKSGAGNPRAAEFGEDVGPCPHSWATGLESWVLGYPAVRQGPSCQAWQDQAPHYRAMHEADLKLLGFKPDLLAAEY